jgi:branched-subunit amino acid permease
MLAFALSIKKKKITGKIAGVLAPVKAVTLHSLVDFSVFSARYSQLKKSVL